MAGSSLVRSAHYWSSGIMEEWRYGVMGLKGYWLFYALHCFYPVK